jgi:hypothetical protein
MEQVLFSIEAVKQKIAQGKHMLLAGDEAALSQLPAGDWIGGTSPYFIGEKGGVSTRESIYVTELPEYIKSSSIKAYSEDTISGVYHDIPENGFGFIIIPAFSAIHMSFALKTPTYPDFATKPLTGWVAGFHLDDLGKTTAKVFDGKTGQALENQAIVMHVKLPANKMADVSILNIFQQGEGDTITFENDGFAVKEALVNGVKRNFADYLLEVKHDTKLPLVSDYYGAAINTSFQTVDAEKHEVAFYAPVFKNFRYRLASPIQDYVHEFMQQIPQDSDNILFSCNCILNYLYSDLEGKQTGELTGPVTFGEVAYQLLNQTMVYLTIFDHAG